MRGRHALPAVLLAATVLSGTANARVTGFQIQSTGPAFDGATFADTGAYERIDAVATIAVDPDAPANAGIADLGKAPETPKERWSSPPRSSSCVRPMRKSSRLSCFMKFPTGAGT